MLTAALISAIVFFLRGGHKSLFITPDLGKKVKKNVGDAERKKKALEIIKSMNALQGRLDKRIKSFKSMLSSLVSDRDITRAEFTDIFKGLLSDYAQTQKKLVDGRMNILSNVTPEEFERIIDRNKKPSDKSWEKAKKGLKKHLDALIKASGKAIKEPNAKKLVIASIELFQKDFEEVITAHEKINFQDHEEFGRYDASKEELLTTLSALNKLRKKLYIAFIDLHQSLAKATSDKQWKAATKALNALLK